MSETLTIDQAASEYDLGRYTILQAIELGDLRLLQERGKSVIPRDSLEHWLRGYVNGVPARRARVQQARREQLAELKRYARGATRAARTELRRDEAELRRQAIEEARADLAPSAPSFSTRAVATKSTGVTRRERASRSEAMETVLALAARHAARLGYRDGARTTICGRPFVWNAAGRRYEAVS